MVADGAIGPRPLRGSRPAGAAAQAGQAGAPAAVTCGGGGQTGVVLVTAADRGMAALGVPRGSGDAGVARDDLPLAVRAKPCALRRELQRCLQTGAGDALPTGQAPAPGPWSAPRRRADQRAAGRGRGSGGAWPLGRRPAAGQAAIGGGDAGGAGQPLCHAGRAARWVQG
jgi:hypothetical protein